MQNCAIRISGQQDRPWSPCDPCHVFTHDHIGLSSPYFLILHKKRIIHVQIEKKMDVYVRRKVRIGTIPELFCAKWEFSLCPPIPELYRTILELRKGYMLKIDKVRVPAQSGNSWTKWEFVKRRDSSWNKTEKWVMRKRFECLIRKTDYSNNIATSFWAK